MPRPKRGQVEVVTPVEDLELRKIEREHTLSDEEAARAHTRALRADRLKAALGTEDELARLYHEKVAEVSVASIDRARDGAKFVQTAATAIFAVYSGLLALVYSVTDNPLPLRGAWAGLFLGLAITMATGYLAFLTTPASQNRAMDNRSLVQRQFSRTANLTTWISDSVNNRRYASRAAVISLFFGVLFIAAPFVSSTRPMPDLPVPTPPEAPAEVAPGFEEDAQALFRAQVEDYENAVAVRTAALAAAEESAKVRLVKEERLDRRIAEGAGLALLLVLLGPTLYSLGERWWLRRGAKKAHP